DRAKGQRRQLRFDPAVDVFGAGVGVIAGQYLVDRQALGSQRQTKLPAAVAEPGQTILDGGAADVHTSREGVPATPKNHILRIIGFAPISRFSPVGRTWGASPVQESP